MKLVHTPIRRTSKYRQIDSAFGPDLEQSQALPQQGYRNYLDWSVAIEHCRPDGTSVNPMTTAPTWIRLNVALSRGLTMLGPTNGRDLRKNLIGRLVLGALSLELVFC
jgi:hypothetical protein